MHDPQQCTFLDMVTMRCILTKRVEVRGYGALPTAPELSTRTLASVHYLRNPAMLLNNEGRRLCITTFDMLVDSLRTPQADCIRPVRMETL